MLVFCAGGAATAAAFAMQYVAPYFAKCRAICSLARRCRDARALVLTYDDGPGNAITIPLLQLLQSHSARATFFPTGRSALPRPDLLDCIVAAGHEVGCHSMNHHHAWRCWPSTASRDVTLGLAALGRWMHPPLLFRPPHGKVTAVSWLAARRARLAWWTIDSGDTRAQLPSTRDVTQRVAVAGGGVVLFHDFDRNGPDRELRARFVLDATEQLLLLARRASLQVQTYGELCGSA